MKKAGLTGYVYDFSFDYNAIKISDILNIHKYLMKKMEQYKMIKVIKQIIISTLMFFGNLSSVNP